MPLFKPTTDNKYTFEISRITEGNFKNLWKLKVKTPNDEAFVEEIDADSLSTVLGRIGYIFEQDGL